MITNGDLFNKFKADYPDLEVEDYRPFYLDFVKDRLGITVWLKNGDILFYFPHIKFNEACELERMKNVSKCAHELCKYWNKERGSCFFFIEGSGEVEDMPCYEETEESDG